LLEFLLEYGRAHALIRDIREEFVAPSQIAGGARCASATSARENSDVATYREAALLPSSSSSRDGRGLAADTDQVRAAVSSTSGGDVALPLDSLAAVDEDPYGSQTPPPNTEARRRSRTPRRQLGEAAGPAEMDDGGQFGIWRQLCSALRWGEMELWQLEHVFRNPESGALTLRQEQSGISLSYGLDAAIPEDLVVAGMRYQVMRDAAPKWAYERFMHHGVSPGIILTPRTPVRPPHCPPLDSNQVEKFVHFDPGSGAWRPGDAIDSRIARVGKLRFQLKLQPGGEVGEDYPEGTWAVAAYIRVVPEASWPGAWEFRDVEYSIYIVPWSEKLSSANFRMRDRFTFNGNGHNNNRGWHDFLTSKMNMVQEHMRDILSPEGYLLVRAEVLMSSALQGPGSALSTVALTSPA